MVPAGVGPFELVCGKFWIIGQFFRGEWIQSYIHVVLSVLYGGTWYVVLVVHTHTVCVYTVVPMVVYTQVYSTIKIYFILSNFQTLLGSGTFGTGTAAFSWFLAKPKN